MLEGVKIKKDWRCFKKGFELKFRSMTLLVGDQGAGKSSIIRLLREPQRHEDIFEACTDKPTNTKSFDFEKDNLRTNPIYNAGQAMSHFVSHGEINFALLESISDTEDTTLIMDEPDMALSIRSAKKLANLFKSLVEKGNQVIASAHNPIVISSFEEVLSLEHKRWMASKEFIEDHLKESP